MYKVLSISVNKPNIVLTKRVLQQLAKRKTKGRCANKHHKNNFFSLFINGSDNLNISHILYVKHLYKRVRLLATFETHIIMRSYRTHQYEHLEE